MGICALFFDAFFDYALEISLSDLTKLKPILAIVDINVS